MLVLSDGCSQITFSEDKAGAAKARNFINTAEALGRPVSDNGTGALRWLRVYEEGQKISLFW